MANLPVNFVDAILASSMNGKRRVRLTEVSTGVYEIEDATEYDQEGSAYGANQVNAVGTAVNGKPDTASIVDTWAAAKLVTQDGVPAGAKALREVMANGNIKFSTVNGKAYYQVGADPVRPFSNSQKVSIITGVTSYTFSDNVVGCVMFAEDATKYYTDDCQNGKHLFGWYAKNGSDRYIVYSDNGLTTISGKTVSIGGYTSGYLIAFFE